MLIGNFGSGKTELAINIALRAAAYGKTELIDCDMVNTYFRLTEYKPLLTAAEIRLVSPNFALSNIETLSLPAEVASAFDMDWDTVVFDAGGDPAGAMSLGRYHSDFSALPEGALEVLNVVNLRRPMSGTADKIIALMEELQRNSRLRVTGLVNNTNLAQLTTAQELRDGYTILREVSERTGVPVAYTAGKPELLSEFLSEGHDARYIGQPLELSTYMRRDWNTWIEGYRSPSTLKEVE